ncbi:MAG: hypothetical protein RL088_225 [Verrucomicrobiota bacterium]|jgi:hypothetical protein
MRRRLKTSGGVLIAIIVVMAGVVAITAVAIAMTAHQGRLTRNSVQHSRMVSLVDSKMERLFNDWRNTMNTLPLGQKPTGAQMAALNSPMPSAVTGVHPGFSSVAGNFIASMGGVDTYQLEEVDGYGGSVPSGVYSVSVGPLPGYDGLFARVHSYRATVGFQGGTFGAALPGVVLRRTFMRSEAPVFQAGIFFEDDLELHPGESMYMNGPVISNHRIYASVLAGKSLTFGSAVIANKAPNEAVPGISYNNRQPSDGGFVEGLPPGSIYSASNYAAPDFLVSKTRQLQLKSRMEPAGRELRGAFDDTDTNPNNDGFRELIEKPDASAPDPVAISNMRFYNQATLRVSVTVVSGTQVVNATGANGTPLPSSVLTKVRDAIGTRAPMYDKREGGNVMVTPVDMGKLALAEQEMRAVTGSSASLTSLVYLSDDSAAAGEKWAFKTVNASRLPSYQQPLDAPSSERGLTIATAGGVYLEGDFNTDTTSPEVPSAIMADAVMFLSNNWNDSRAANPISGVDDGAGGIVPGSARVATETTYHTAIMAGTIPSGYDPTPNAPNSGDEYGPGGGAHNFPRMLEKWTGVNMNFKGSMVQLFTSKLFTGRWQTGDVYHPPVRNWSANENFVKRPPPGLFSFAMFSRGPWRRL